MSVEALEKAYGGITALVDGLDDYDLLRPTGCRGWTIADLLLHVTGDAQGALVAFATPTPEPATVDSVTYWHKFSGSSTDAAAAHAQWVRRSAAAFERPSGVLGLWSETAPAAVRAARAFDPEGRLASQGHVFTRADFLAVLVTEAVIHHLDLIAYLPEAPEPDPSPAAITRATLDGLAGADGLPRSWATREALLKGTGRAALTETDRRLLGDRADSFPLLA
jgi:uncharacterized protein (TIGR03083 family)